MKPMKKKEQEYLDPAWLAKTAKLAMKRGTAIVFGANRCVYGILPKGGGSVNVFYEPDERWLDAVLAKFPGGAVFPNDNVYGGPATAKALRAYANVRLPEDGTGKAWIDPVTNALHVKGLGVVVHSATVEANDTPVPAVPLRMRGIDVAAQVPKDIGKLLVDFTRRDDNRPFLKRVYCVEDGDRVFLGSTDSRSAILHRVEDFPTGFSFDPTLVNLYDVTGYNHDKTETGADVHSFRLADGTVFVEKVAGIPTPNLCAKMEAAFACDHAPLISAEGLLRLEADVVSLGLGANDTWGGVVKFSEKGVVILSGNQPMAEMDAAVGLEDGLEIMLAVPILSRLAKLGAEARVIVNASMNVVRCASETTRIIAAPMSPPVGAQT